MDISLHILHQLSSILHLSIHSVQVANSLLQVVSCEMNFARLERSPAKEQKLIRYC